MRRLLTCLMALFLFISVTSGCAASYASFISADTTVSIEETRLSSRSEPADTTATQNTPATTPSSTSLIETSADVTTDTPTEPVPSATPSPSPKPTAKPTPRPTVKPTPKPTTPPSPYYLYAEKGSSTLAAYERDDAGNYTRLVRTMRMAYGRSTMTPNGKFTLTSRVTWKQFSTTNYAPFGTQYRSGLYIHGPLYQSKSNTTMKDDSYESIGTQSTAGCLRLTTADALWVFNNCPSGTILEIVSGTPRGLTTPALKPIIISGQDPTDPSLPQASITPAETTSAETTTPAATTTSAETTAPAATTTSVETSAPAATTTPAETTAPAATTADTTTTSSDTTATDP